MATSVKDIDSGCGLRRELSVRDLTLFGIVCIAGPRWIPAAAHAGPGSVTLWLLAGLLLGAPLAVAVAALMTKYPEPGGLYSWTRNDFGPAHGFLAFWVYWVGMAFWFPGAAVFYLSSTAYTFGPAYAHLADNRAFIICGSLAAIWIALGSNLVGLKTGKWTENFGAIAVALLGAILIVAAAVSWSRHGSVTPIHLAPKMDWSTATFWAAIAYGVSGAEYFGMMSAEIRSPERTVKPAIWLATAFAVVFYAAATLAMLVLLRPEAISEISGIASGGEAVSRVFGAPWISAVIGLLVLTHAFGAFGGIGTAVSRMPFAAGTDRLLPDAFGRVHSRWHTPHVALLTLGVVSSVLLLLAQLGDTMRVAYQEIVSLTLIGGFLPYVYIFISAWKAGRRAAAGTGLGVTAFCLVCSVMPTSQVSNVWLFEGKLVAGTVVMIGSGLLLYSRGRAKARKSVAEAA
ncbi:APC family permease [Edaphobacter bradus]|uniref:APC family permease n=1 Tax=Edaphobacter bradus TaxID=2259016 RepID=UPI0021E0D9BE|nr:APC family permease [Edaphobacter bradus]